MLTKHPNLRKTPVQKNERTDDYLEYSGVKTPPILCVSNNHGIFNCLFAEESPCVVNFVFTQSNFLLRFAKLCLRSPKCVLCKEQQRGQHHHIGGKTSRLH